MKETWKHIKGYDGKYMVSNKGNVWSKKRNRMLKQIDNGKGYLRVSLSFMSKRKLTLVHKLVAEHFLQREVGKEYVNHIDENKSNNISSNLEWCTAKYNLNYGTRNQRIIDSRRTSQKWLKEQTTPVIGVNIKDNSTIVFISMMEAERNGFHSGHISECVRGKAKSHKGYKWFKQSEYKVVS